MNLTRRSRREDALFVIALVVPAIFAGARYVESGRELDQIAQAQAVVVASASHAPANLVLAQAGHGVR